MKLTLFILLSFVIKLSFSQCPDGYVLKDSNLVYNGDFYHGNNGFSTEYKFSRDYHWSFVPTADLAVGRYNIVHSPMYVHPAFATCADKDGKHTPMFVADGYTGQVDLWRQKIKVKPNTHYFAQVYHSSSCCSDGIYTEMGLFIDDQEVDYGETNDTCKWEKLEYLWHSENNNSLNLAIQNISTEWYGNDMMIDNISVKECVKKTDAITKELKNINDTIFYDEEHIALINPHKSFRIQDIQFLTKKSELKAEAFPSLDMIAGFLKNKGKVLKVELSVHLGVPEKTKVKARMLSQRRAETVKQYLVAQGIEENRILANGLGYTQPIKKDIHKTSIQLNERVMVRFYEDKSNHLK